MHRFSIEHLSDAAILQGMRSLRGRERAAAALLIAFIAEAETRKLFLSEACDSMVRYCERELGLSEDEALKRIHAGRVARRFPQAFEMLADGRLHMTGVNVLAPHLTEGNVDELLAASSGRSKTAIQQILAALPEAGAPRSRVGAPGPPGTRLCPGAGRRLSRRATARAGSRSHSAGASRSRSGATERARSHPSPRGGSLHGAARLEPSHRGRVAGVRGSAQSQDPGGASRGADRARDPPARARAAEAQVRGDATSGFATAPDHDGAPRAGARASRGSRARWRVLHVRPSDGTALWFTYAS